MSEPITQMRVQVFGSKNQPGSVHSQLVKMIGRNGAEEMENFLNAVEDPTPKHDSRTVRNLIRYNANVRTAYLNLSGSVLAIQPITARLMYSFGVPVASMEYAFLKDLASIVGVHSIQELMDYSPIFWERYERIPAVYMESEGINHKARRAWVAPTSVVKKLSHVRSLQEVRDILRRSEDSTLATLAYFDSRAISMILSAVKHWGAMEGWSDAQIKAKVIEIVTQSQPMNDALFTSNFLSNKNALYKATFGVYQSARDGLRRVEQLDKMAAQNRLHGQKGQGSLARHIIGFINAAIVVNALTALVQTAFRRFGKDDDEKDMSFLEDWWWNTLTNRVGLRPILGALIASGINFWKRGWPVETGEAPLAGASAEVVRDSVTFLSSIADDINKDELAFGEKEEESESLERGLKLGVKLTVFNGTAWYNIERQIEKILKVIQEEEKDPSPFK
jgi:hypothetical protein